MRQSGPLPDIDAYCAANNLNKARLIAFAPELLEQLKLARNRLVDAGWLAEDLKDLDAALNNATGDSK